MLFGMPLAIILGIATIISVFIAASFGIAMYHFNKNVFRYHRFFAFLTLILAVIHAILAYLLYYGIFVI